MLINELAIYASPLRTLATDLALKNADKNVYYTSNNDKEISKAAFLATLNVLAKQVMSTLGFGLDSTTDIYTTSPLITEQTASGAQQTAVLAYKIAVSALIINLQTLAKRKH